jgi:restriction system protein
MARRKQSGAEDFMDLVALLPWWASVGLAILSCLVQIRQFAALAR